MRNGAEGEKGGSRRCSFFRLYCSGADRDRLSAEAQARRFIVNQLLMMRAELDASSQKEGTRVHTRIMFRLWTHFLLLLFGSARRQTFFL